MQFFLGNVIKGGFAFPCVSNVVCLGHLIFNPVLSLLFRPTSPLAWMTSVVFHFNVSDWSQSHCENNFQWTQVKSLSCLTVCIAPNRSALQLYLSWYHPLLSPWFLLPNFSYHCIPQSGTAVSAWKVILPLSACLTLTNWRQILLHLSQKEMFPFFSFWSIG